MYHTPLSSARDGSLHSSLLILTGFLFGAISTGSSFIKHSVGKEVSYCDTKGHSRYLARLKSPTLRFVFNTPLVWEYRSKNVVMWKENLKGRRKEVSERERRVELATMSLNRLALYHETQQCGNLGPKLSCSPFRGNMLYASFSRKTIIAISHAIYRINEFSGTMHYTQ
ncbi:uncharacterized protein BDR25DRAFT_355898 [Lindgomyces ingoldianus]|uniref:Uncharacterized protein n=1 Tax=Lindgomyces ingoldianus TaxID=673940 RepID=A0ACB6QVI1_9PLEO|nr:uncharacterized protein BDR25DRAFT_355898 [Lindgomyces ingoldianus]KAF2470196.1 hypothetical protein BDR25DRAFT_355898 [Lindgomyces ingoldianus]